MMVTAAKHDDYLELLTTFPPRVIRSEAELKRAYETIETLMRARSLSRAQRDYLELLSMLVTRREAERDPFPNVSQAQMLSHFMEAKGVTQAQLARETGITAATLSSVRAGRRALSKANIRKLSEYFHVEQCVWL
jgi:HTH-type transcriptional regulator/antitoxin HigA